MGPFRRNVSVLAVSGAVCLLLSGCAMGNLDGSSSGSTTLPRIVGTVHGGQQPVSGASVQLYAASTTATAGASTPLLKNPVTTGSDGSFNITGDYTCPTPGSLVYLVGTGGNPGLGGTVYNSAISMMSLVGICSSLSSTTHIIVNELTTVGSVQALAAFMTDYAHIGANASNPNGLAGAFYNATQLVDFSNGILFSQGAAYYPFLTTATIADILAACVNTNGTSGMCGTLFTNAANGTTISDTVSAALHIVQSPGNNATALYGLVGSNPPFQPYYTTTPTDLTTTVGYVLPANLITGGLDPSGHVWLYTAGYSYDPVANTSTDLVGTMTVYDNNLNQLFTVANGSGGLYYPQSMAFDAAGHAYVVNSNSTISEFSSNGSPISPSGGWSTGFANTFTGTGSYNGYITPDNGVGQIKVDGLGNIWGTVASGSASCYFEMNSSGQVVAATGNYCATTNAGYIENGAPDGSGSSWADSYYSISKIDSNGNFSVAAPTSPGCFDPSNLTTHSAQMTKDIVYDHSHNQVWGYSDTGLGTITDAGTAVFCDLGSTNLPVIAPTASPTTTPGNPYSASALEIVNGVVDGAGTLWYATSGYTATGVVGTPGTFTGTATFNNYLNGITTSGTLKTTYNAATQTYGLQPVGFGANGTASVTNGLVYNGGSASLLGVDPFGNIWAYDASTTRLMKIAGLAAANTTNY